MAIFFEKNTKTFYLEGKGYTYSFFINSYGYLEHLYFGERIGRDVLLYTRTTGDDSKIATIPGLTEKNALNSYQRFPSEISFFGTGDYREPTVHVENAGGDRLTELLYESHEILTEKPKMKTMPSMRGQETLIIHLTDPISNFAADLYYSVYDDASVIARRAVYKNFSKNPLTLRRAYSFNLALPDNEYDVLTLHGAWGRERAPERCPLHHGVHSIDSKKTSSSAALNPFFAIMRKDSTEDSGDVIAVNLVYSSSFVMKAESNPDGTAQVFGGINDFDFSWKLESGDELEVPEVVIAYSKEGLGGMSRELHDAYRNHLIAERFAKKPHPIVLNTWEGMYFNFNTDKLIAVADAIAGTGIDTFVLDDGWFGKRNDDTSSLGDWFVDTGKLPDGLTPVIERVRSNGMKFGIWFEPEMISENSELYKKHPDYAIKVPDRESCRCRNQLVLDITRQDVRDYIVESVNNILHNNKIDYVKWDYNRNVTESYSIALPPERQSEFAHRYALGLYELCERIIEANPEIIFEGCSGCGARFDPAMLYYFPQNWTSDNTDAEARAAIQYGTSIAYPLSSMSCHVAFCYKSRTTSFETRGNIASLGAFGYELDATKLTQNERSAIKEQIEEYKASEDLILEGNLYRIDDPHSSNYFSFMTVSKDKKRAKLTLYRSLFKSNDTIKRIKAKGLDPSKKYYVRELALILHGSTLMNVGIVPRFANSDFASCTFHFEEK